MNVGGRSVGRRVALAGFSSSPVVYAHRAPVWWCVVSESLGVKVGPQGPLVMSGRGKVPYVTNNRAYPSA